MPRLFVGIDLPEAHKARLAGLRDDALPGRWTPSSKYHLTLRFIGEVDEHRAAMVEQALADCRAEAFSLQGRGMGVFPSQRRPRVLFAAIDATPVLFALQQQVEQALRDIGLEAEPKPFRPHVTLARLRQAEAQAVRTFLDAHQAFTLAPFQVDQFHLYESVLRREGALHTSRASYGLTDGR